MSILLVLLSSVLAVSVVCFGCMVAISLALGAFGSNGLLWSLRDKPSLLWSG